MPCKLVKIRYFAQDIDKLSSEPEHILRMVDRWWFDVIRLERRQEKWFANQDIEDKYLEPDRQPGPSLIQRMQKLQLASKAKEAATSNSTDGSQVC
ncbi:hypothetical protein ABW21_db0205272 [Orbilia brochopaga]|nr:hypothetical protein ABW21_db0205272 [Drechslerella brochopaga]